MSPRSTLAPSLARVAAELSLVQALLRGTLARRAGFRAETARAAGAVLVLPEEAEALLFDLSLSEQVEPQFEQRLRLVEAERDAAYKAGEPISQLRKAFSLTRRELTVWMLCAAPQLDYRYGRLYGLVLDDPARGYASEDLLQAVLSVGLSTHAQLRAQIEASAPLRALGLIELAPAAIGRAPGLRVPAWLIDFMLSVGEGTRASEPPLKRTSSPTDDQALAHFWSDGASLKREYHHLVGSPALLTLDRVCARARLKLLTLDLRRVSSEKMRAEVRRASHLAALREHALVVILPASNEAGARSAESFVRAELAQDFVHMAKHLPLCASVEEEVEP